MATSAETRQTRGAELLGLLAFAVALMLLIALATFDPRDPAPFFKAGGEDPARNFIGPFGAFLAEMLIPQLFGLAALLLPIALGLLGWKLFWCRPVDAPYTKAVGNLVLLLCLAALLSLAFGTVSFEGEPVRAGGAIGELLSSILVADFSRTGAYIVCSTALFLSLILATQFSFSSFLRGAGSRVGGRLRALRTAFTHYRESRRKERMRREVIRKHTAAHEPEGGGLPRIRRVKAGAGEEDPAPADVDDLPLHAAPPPGPRSGRCRSSPRRPRKGGPRRTSPRRRARPPPAAAVRATRRTGAARRGAATSCPRSPSWTRRRAAPRWTTTGCSRRAASCRGSAASSG
jgi:hypothetical protein